MHELGLIYFLMKFEAPDADVAIATASMATKKFAKRN